MPNDPKIDILPWMRDESLVTRCLELLRQMDWLTDVNIGSINNYFAQVTFNKHQNPEASLLNLLAILEVEAKKSSHHTQDAFDRLIETQYEWARTIAPEREERTGAPRAAAAAYSTPRSQSRTDLRAMAELVDIIMKDIGDAEEQENAPAENKPQGVAGALDLPDARAFGPPTRHASVKNPSAPPAKEHESAPAKPQQAGVTGELEDLPDVQAFAPARDTAEPTKVEAPSDIHYFSDDDDDDDDSQQSRTTRSESPPTQSARRVELRPPHTLNAAHSKDIHGSTARPVPAYMHTTKPQDPGQHKDTRPGAYVSAVPAAAAGVFEADEVSNPSTSPRHQHRPVDRDASPAVNDHAAQSTPRLQPSRVVQSQTLNKAERTLLTQQVGRLHKQIKAISVNKETSAFKQRLVGSLETLERTLRTPQTPSNITQIKGAIDTLETCTQDKQFRTLPGKIQHAIVRLYHACKKFFERLFNPLKQVDSTQPRYSSKLKESFFQAAEVKSAAQALPAASRPRSTQSFLADDAQRTHQESQTRVPVQKLSARRR